MDSNLIGGIIVSIVVIGFIAWIVFPAIKDAKARVRYIEYTHDTQCCKCNKWHHEGESYCTDCHVLITGPCPNCQVDQKWRGPGCTQCGYDTKTGVPVSSSIKSPTSVRATPTTSPSLTTINLLCCPNCRNQISPESIHCGNCGFNLEQTVVREQE